MKPLFQGDYVLATKYSDGDPCDHFCIGFFRGKMFERFLVEDRDGTLFRHGGFSRCEKISERVGNALVAASHIIGDKRGKSVWWWRRHIAKLEQLCELHNKLGLEE